MGNKTKQRPFRAEIMVKAITGMVFKASVVFVETRKMKSSTEVRGRLRKGCQWLLKHSNDISRRLKLSASGRLILNIINKFSYLLITSPNFLKDRLSPDWKVAC